MKIEVRCPAKVNLYLDVLNKRKDGYYEVVTVLQAIDLWDTIFLSERKSGIEIHCGDDLPSNEDNLTFQSASILMKEEGIKTGISIELSKRIPIGAGLGGGSSDAAGVLVGLNELWGLHLKAERLIEIGRKVGSDVPFFISLWEDVTSVGSIGGGIRLGLGRGDEITPLPAPEDMWLILINFDFRVSTGEIYRSLGTELTNKKKDFKMALEVFKTGNFRAVRGALYNKLEEPVFRRFPAVEREKIHLANLCDGAAVMTGSGPAVFGLAESKKEAVGIKDCLAGNLKKESICVRKSLSQRS